MQRFNTVKLGEKPSSDQSNDLNESVKSLFSSSQQSPAQLAQPGSSSTDAKQKKASKDTRALDRVTSELEAAIALHKAGVRCRVRKVVVCAVKGWSRPTLYRRIASQQFPKPIKDGRSSWWWIADVINDP